VVVKGVETHKDIPARDIVGVDSTEKELSLADHSGCAGDAGV